MKPYQPGWATVYVDAVYKFKAHRGGWAAGIKSNRVKAAAFGRVPDMKLDRGKQEKSELVSDLVAILGGVWLAQRVDPSAPSLRIFCPSQAAIDVLIDPSTQGLRSDHESSFFREYQARFADLSWKAEGLRLCLQRDRMGALVERAMKGAEQDEKAVLEFKETLK